MKRTGLFMRLGFALLFVLASLATVRPASATVPRHGCKDRCNEAYHWRKRECNGLRRGEKHRCEERAKWEHNECKRSCR